MKSKTLLGRLVTCTAAIANVSYAQADTPNDHCSYGTQAKLCPYSG